MKRCLICWTSCTSCRGSWKCRCGMTQEQVLISNELILENQIPLDDYRPSWITDLLISWETKDDINIKLQVWLEEWLQSNYVRTTSRRVIVDTGSERCKYDWLWVWSKCIRCWVARRDKQKDLSKKCDGAI